MNTEDEEICAVLVWQWMQIIDLEESDKRMWVHPINRKRDEQNSLKKFVAELKEDETKFRNFTRLSLGTFNHILSMIEHEIRKCDTNLRKSITPEERLLVTLRYVDIT